MGKGSTKLQNNSISKAFRDCVNLEEKLTGVSLPRVEVDQQGKQLPQHLVHLLLLLLHKIPLCLQNTSLLNASNQPLQIRDPRPEDAVHALLLLLAQLVGGGEGLLDFPFFPFFPFALLGIVLL